MFAPVDSLHFPTDNFVFVGVAREMNLVFLSLIGSRGKSLGQTWMEEGVSERDPTSD